MKTVPLHGKKAAGRVALVDDEDYDLVIQHRWNIWEPEPKPGCRQEGPYAITNINIGESGSRRQIGIRMHTLLTGWPLVDHQDHDGLNNQRSNLRLATPGENARNARTRISPKTSQYKGVAWAKTSWVAYIQVNRNRRHLGNFTSELEAAYTYDTAARELHGEFACTNFPEPASQAMLDQWREEGVQRSEAAKAAADHALAEGRDKWWSERESETRACADCGAKLQSRSTKRLLWCKKCRRRIDQQRQREGRAAKRQQERAALSRPVT